MDGPVASRQPLPLGEPLGRAYATNAVGGTVTQIEIDRIRWNRTGPILATQPLGQPLHNILASGAEGARATFV